MAEIARQGYMRRSVKTVGVLFAVLLVYSIGIPVLAGVVTPYLSQASELSQCEAVMTGTTCCGNANYKAVNAKYRPLSTLLNNPPAPTAANIVDSITSDMIQCSCKAVTIFSTISLEDGSCTVNQYRVSDLLSISDVSCDNISDEISFKLNQRTLPSDEKAISSNNPPDITEVNTSIIEVDFKPAEDYTSSPIDITIQKNTDYLSVTGETSLQSGEDYDITVRGLRHPWHGAISTSCTATN